MRGYSVGSTLGMSTYRVFGHAWTSDVHTEFPELKSCFFKQKTAYEIMPSLVGSEMCIRDRYHVCKRLP